MAVGEKGQTGRRPLRRERAKLGMSESLEVPRDLDRKVERSEGREGQREERNFSVGVLSGRAREVGRPKRAAAPPRLNSLGRQEGARLLWGDKTAGAPIPGREGLVAKSQSGVGGGNISKDPRGGGKL
jgi:hypothetical protein